ncbi:MAG: hypothetical protein P4M11_14890 [Candidatus Pacebacteria bacterium]|nr:hypothetical protein [Candidatus Paceibacterota bacterium]
MSLNFLRKMVSGKRNRYKEDGFDLDLTYITPRIIASSYPASGIEATYRNKVTDVSTWGCKSRNRWSSS